nr:hypothetical protein Iba_chr12dCG20090 [Ipomoea batatas]
MPSSTAILALINCSECIGMAIIGTPKSNGHGGFAELLRDVVDVLPLDFPASVDQTEFRGHLQGPWDGGSVNGVYIFRAFTQILELVWLHTDGRKREPVDCSFVQEVVDEGIRGCTSNGVEDGGDVPRCGGLRRPGLEGIIDEQVGFDLVEDVAEAWAGQSEFLAEGENEVAREIFCGVAAGRKKLREIAGGVQVDFHRMDFIRVKGRRGFSRRDDNRGRTQIYIKVAVVELIGKFQEGDKQAENSLEHGLTKRATAWHCWRQAKLRQQRRRVVYPLFCLHFHLPIQFPHFSSHLFSGLLRHHALYRFGYIFSVKPAITIPHHLRGDAQLHRHPGAHKLLRVHGNGYYRNSKPSHNLTIRIGILAAALLFLHSDERADGHGGFAELLRDVVDVLPLDFPASVEQQDFGGHLPGSWDSGSINGVVGEGNRGRPSDAVVDGGDFPRCGGLRRPKLEEIIDEQIRFDLVEDVAEAWAGHPECLTERENEVAREIFCGVAAGRKKLREIPGRVQVDFHRMNFIRVKRRRGFSRRDDNRGRTQINVEVAVVELIGKFHVGDKVAMSQPWQH